MRFLPAGENALLVQLGSLDEVLSLHASLRAKPVPGMAEMIPAAETLLIGFDPYRISAAELAAEIAPRDLSHRDAGTGREVEIPVDYDGQDLDEVAALTDLSRAEVIARHTGTPWLAAFNGFAPGFCYLTGGDPALDVPRRATPRTEIPAGSVALAGTFSGVYPQSSPGGWQIIGTAPVPMWDLNRDPPALLAPGDRVRFVDQAKAGRLRSQPARPSTPELTPPAARWDILAAPFPALLQDAGRVGLADQGIAASGSVDQGALRALNRLLGNSPGTAALEVLGGGLRLRATAPCTVAATGAPRQMQVNGAPFASHRVIALDAGDELALGPADSGTYGYLGVRGGFTVEPVLGSAATDTLAQIGPKVLRAGDWLGLAGARAEAVQPPLAQPALPRPGDLVEIEVTMGPRADWFTPQVQAQFLAQDWLVTPQSSRVGKRLEGQPLQRDARELPSEATPAGAIQIPHSGQPVLFLADHPLTGGYPVMAVVAAHHLDLAAQVPPGARIRFRARAPFAPIIPNPSRGRT
ncbi:5-oxoprolinase subunit B/C family protein [Paracoccus xiamenensis]|uniref:5-oxoprolinase subunit B/C family protein n=1 Tax=Paracoccus xiamenensis TaxID=2714901 RepID=UPI00140BBF18|nr:urea amidolyase family protein [Paracoccus xiamenensis]NHF73443.1 5-oxoprolinase/urea amidolyase family protein [Paracoccus xiamenensis]